MAAQIEVHEMVEKLSKVFASDLIKLTRYQCH